MKLKLVLVALCASICATAVYISACPFCSALNLTFAEQIKTNDIVVIARLLEIPEPVEDPDAELPRSIFEITDVIKGDDVVRAGMKFNSLLIGKYPIGNEFLVMGVDPPNVAWSTPMSASDRVVEYLQTIQTLPKSGTERLAFFQKYFEDKESVLAFDAYDEFAQAPYEDVVALKDKMDRPQLVKWIKDPDTSVNRRRLYLTMLGVCGENTDVEMLEEFIKSGDRKQQGGLDALVACYLKLKGESGLGLIVDTFLKDENVEYVDTLATVMALRFHADELDVVPKAKIVEAVRTVLDRPNIADMIIPDLARWKDWSVLERLVKMFKDTDADASWLRVAIATYLRACPKPEAAKYIAELQQIDPDAIKRADFFLDFSEDEEDSWGNGKSDSSGDTDEKKTESNSPKSDSKSDSKSKMTDEPDGANDGDVTARAAGSISETYVAKRIPLDESEAIVSISTKPRSSGKANPSSARPVLNVESDQVESGEEAASLPPKSVIPAQNLTARRRGVGSQMAVSVMPAQAGIQTAAPVAAAPRIEVRVWQLIVIPFACSVGIFVLLWSVISGWFDRLIF